MPKQLVHALRKRAVPAITIDARPSKGGVGEQTKSTRNGLYLHGRVAGDSVRFLVDKGSNVLLIALQIWRRWGGGREELGHYRGRCRLFSVEGRALECLGQVLLHVDFGT